MPHMTLLASLCERIQSMVVLTALGAISPVKTISLPSFTKAPFSATNASSSS